MMRSGITLEISELFDQPTIADIVRKAEASRDRARQDLEVMDATLSMIEDMADEEVQQMIGKLDGQKAVKG